MKKSNKTKGYFLGTRIPDSQNIQLECLANDLGLNKSKLVRIAISDLLSNHAYQKKVDNF